MRWCAMGGWGALFFVFQAEDGIRDVAVTGVQTCALPIVARDPRVHARITGYTIPLPQAEPFPASEVQISPDSSQVIAQASNYVYLVALPLVGGTPVAINVSDPSSASFPVKKLTRVGGDFVGWSADAKSVYWSIGRTFFRHDIAAADSAEKPKARADSVRADSLKGDAFKALPDSVKKRLRSRN